MGDANGFPLDLPDFGNPVSIQAWQEQMAERLDFTINQGITTGDGVTTALVTIALESLTVYGIESWVLGTLNSTTGVSVPGQAQLTVFRGAFKLDVSNVAQVVGAGVSKIYAGVNLGASSEPWTTSLTTDSNTIVQNVTGTANDLIHWRCAMKIFQVSV